MTRKSYRKKQDQLIAAVQLDLDTDGFSYRKWGGKQTCQPGDWLVNNGGDTYTIAADSFAQTYQPVSPGLYRKTSLVWAERAAEAGRIDTKEGSTDYAAGDYIVFNCADGSDGYAVEAAIFESTYEEAD